MNQTISFCQYKGEIVEATSSLNIMGVCTLVIFLVEEKIENTKIIKERFSSRDRK